MYSIRAYYLAKNMIETPPALLVPTCYMIFMYWTVGFPDEHILQNFLKLVLVGFLLINSAIGYGYFISATFKS
jgi:hypothetical protein